MEVLTHKCPNCGGPLTFNPEDQKFHCDYCLNIYTEAEVSQFEEKQLESQVPNQEAVKEESVAAESSEMQLFNCPSCGAEIVTDATTAATYCYYCHNPVVLSGRLSGEFLPNKVLPFAIEKEEAVEKFLAWTNKKWFVPKAFFNKQQIEKLTGVYFPYWNVEADLTGQMSATGTSIRVWRVGEIEYTETKVFDVERSGRLNFKNLVKNALSKNTPQKMVHMVQPFPLEKAIPFKSQYLAGFQAEKRDIEFQQLEKEVNQDLQKYSQDLLRETVNGYTSLTNVHSNISTTSTEKEYLLLPVWILTYRNKRSSDKFYFYAMNGQTGKISGILPIDYRKLALVSGGIFLAVLILSLIGGYFI
ncbi:DNA-directed RNA polymerase subunit M/transcription elongation factor TFIIS [Enterococcus sp. PF1-24]|uniref:TFIIB-type zinc ribbon-containing protein n=1 Tax=unclassified Enterococcus TaxID=2608891 RepID=UPI00247428DD|nr:MULTISPECIES: TFIIB-type zinc ribbon-containing protein [unclassified Enterococcus]MDH6365761.1 DNA-directed RNA polymerase subunit M/transcription elongation factor TFIIS [Enterococcus sp. PFB1-1]MDH6402856.1 DNA-directed RNA polymerase subunit M/transcription elongation factor TFIIS [Enterococcus sp. PF1-24]